MNIALISDNKIQYSFQGCDITCYTSAQEVKPKDWVCYDAAFLVHPFSEKALDFWTGHPHLRCIDGINALDNEIDYLFTGIECEIKLLIKIPNESFFKKYRAFKCEIEQVYLKGDGGSHRVRKRTMGDTVNYVETVKMRISSAVSKEYENTISEYEYNELLKRSDKTKHPIYKSRYCFIYKRQYYELDIYDFWSDRATLELEMKSENESYELPPEIEVIKDVTDDKRYKNNKLAGINYEDYNTELL